MKKIILVAFVTLSSLVANAQLRIKSVESYNPSYESISINESNGEITKGKGQLPAGEKVIRSSGHLMFAAAKDSAGRKVIRKYSKHEHGLTNEGAVVADPASTVFFDNNDFVVVDNSEKSVKIYSQGLHLVKELNPYEGRCKAIQYHLRENHLVLATVPTDTTAHSIVLFLNHHGHALATITLPDTVQVSEVLCSHNFFAAYGTNTSNNNHEIWVYNHHGQFLWKKQLDSQIRKWCFHESVPASLVISTLQELMLFNSHDGSLFDQKKLRDIYTDAAIKKARQDDYVEIIALEPVLHDQFMGVLIAEPVGSGVLRNTILYCFSYKLNTTNQVLRLGDSATMPSIKSIRRDVFVIKDKEVLTCGL